MVEYWLIIAKSVILSGLLYGYYYLFLRDRPFHRYNRVYLLAAAVLAMVLPFLRIALPVMAGAVETSPLTGTLRVITGSVWEEQGAARGNAAETNGWLNIGTGVWAIYLTGMGISLLLFIKALVYILKIRRRYRFEQVAGIRLYETAERSAPFSFFRSIFWHERIAFNSREGQQIFRHELMHVRQRHSHDIVWMECCCMLAWFNPFFHLMKRELSTVHEFLADEYAMSGNNPLDYAELLLVQSIGQRKLGLTSPMFYQTIKRRVTMITSMNRGRHGRSGRLMILPVAVILFCLFAFRVVPGPRHSGATRAGSGEPLTVMIDAGHGGIDPGASGYFGGVDEKVLTLQLAQTIKAHEAEYNVHIVLTRNEDVLPGGAADKQQGLVNRVDMAKAAGAKAFISLHVNNDGKPGATSETGYECFISKNRESKGSELLASSLLKRLGSVYTTKQQIMKRSEEGIYVLDHNDCSAVLLECGFINNAKDVAFFKDNQDVIAKTILQGIVDAQTAR